MERVGNAEVADLRIAVGGRRRGHGQFATYYGRFTDDLRAICDVLRTINGRFTCNLRRITEDLRTNYWQFATYYGRFTSVNLRTFT